MIGRNDFKKILGDNIRRMREERGVSLNALGKAKEISLGKSSIINIEKGRQHVSAYQLVAIASALNTDLSDLLDGLLLESKELKKLKKKSKKIFEKA